MSERIAFLDRLLVVLSVERGFAGVVKSCESETGKQSSAILNSLLFGKLELLAEIDDYTDTGTCAEGIVDVLLIDFFRGN